MVDLAPYVTSYAPSGMVCSVDHLASVAGVDMLRRGGSAVDAAIAASAVLTVTTQHMCGMGGDLFALVHTGDREPPAVLNASGRAGSGADPERLRSAGYTTVPRLLDIGAVTVPGCVDGWCELHATYGTLPLADVLEPARVLAAEGFTTSPTLAGSARSLFALRNPATGDYTEGRQVLRPGDLVRRPGVARALEAIARDGRAGFYGGEFGAGLIDVGNGEFDGGDLERPLADWVDGLSIEAWGHRLWTVPPNSQGYLTLAGAWIADRLSLPDDHDDGAWVHLLVEAARQAAFDRIEVLHEHANGAALLAPERLRPRADAISLDRAATLGDSYDAGGTMYLCAADARTGMGVSLIQSNYAGFGSMIIEPNTRIFLQNRGAGFNLVAGHPAEYGPGRRPPHTLAPAMVTKLDGALDCLVGTMGGDTQPQVLLQLLARRYGPGRREDPARAIAAPRFGLLGPGGKIDIWQGHGQVSVGLEAHAPSAWRSGLEARGHRVESIASWSGDVGHAHMIEMLPNGGVAGAADPRSLGGAAVGL